MKKTFLLLTMLTLLPTITHTKIEDNFHTIAYKKDGFVKTTNEIPQFKNISPEQKKEWDKLARQTNEMKKQDNQTNKKLKPLKEEILKLGNTIYEKIEKLNQELENLLKDNPEYKKLKTQEKKIQPQIERISQQYISLSKKIEPIKNKQLQLMKAASQKKYGSATGWLMQSQKEDDTFEAKIKKTKEYQALEQQLKPFKMQQKKLKEKEESLNYMGIVKQINTLKEKTKQSKDFPASLKKLDNEIKQIDKKRDTLRKKLRERERKELNRHEIMSNMQKLNSLLDQIKKESK